MSEGGDDADMTKKGETQRFRMIRRVETLLERK